MRTFIFMLLLCLLILPAFCQGGDNPLPTIACEKIDRELKLTGKMDDPLWRQAQVVTLVSAYDGIIPRFHTTARMLYNDRYLYVAFTCEDSYIWGTYTKRDDPIYGEEVIEVFLCPTNFIRNYYEIEVSPLNTVLDTYVLNGRSQDTTDWNNFHTFFDYNINGLITKTTVTGELNKDGAGKSWTVEMAIPFYGLIGQEPEAPAPDTSWRLNFYRCDLPEKGKNEFYAWSPIMEHTDLHRPWRFGTVVFQNKMTDEGKRKPE